MSRALQYLLFLQANGALRKLRSNLLSLRGIFYVVLTLATFGTLLLTQASPLDPMLTTLGLQDTGNVASGLHRWLPLALLGLAMLTLVAASGPAVSYSRSELNWLVSAPFKRRELFAYKFSLFAFGALISALLVALLTPGGDFSTVFMGIFQILLFAQLLNVCIRLQLTGTRIGAAMFANKTRLLFAVLAVIGLLILSMWLPGLFQWPVKLLSSIFVPFTRTLLADSAASLVTWSIVATAINATLLLFALHWSERDAEDSGARGSATPDRKSFQKSPILAGIGPHVWRHLIEAYRGSRWKVLSLTAVMALSGPVLLSVSGNRWAQIGLVFVIIVHIMPKTLVFDFRGDLRLFSFLCSLPASRWSIVSGQVIVPILIGTCMVLVMAATSFPYLSDNAQTNVLRLTPMVPLFVGLLFAIENLLFLLFPKDHVPIGRVAFDYLGRTLVEIFTKTVVLLAAAALTVRVIVVVAGMTEGAVWPFTAAWLCVLLLLIINLQLLVWALARAANRLV